MARRYRRREQRPYVLRTVVTVRRGDYYDGTDHDWVKLSCGHIVTPANNGRTLRVEGKTKARCYECGLSSHRFANQPK